MTATRSHPGTIGFMRIGIRGFGSVNDILERYAKRLAYEIREAIAQSEEFKASY
jgi:hypothetical protein